MKYSPIIYEEDKSQARAIEELTQFVREIGSKNLLRIKEYIERIRSLNAPTMSDNLNKYIKSRSNYELKIDIKRIIIKNPNDSVFSSFVPHINWFRTRKSFSCYYGYNCTDFLNVFSIPTRDLPLYLNNEFSEEIKEIYLKRMRGYYNGN